MSKTKPLIVVLGNQLFPPAHLARFHGASVYMAEDMGLCTYERHHQQKIVLFLAAMRAYADELREAGFDVHYRELDPDRVLTYEEGLAACLDKTGADQLVHFEIEDKPMERRIIDFADARGITRKEIESPMFLCGRDRFAEFAARRKTLRMADFYKEERLRLDIMVEGEGEPLGGRWSFDTENRKKLPKNVTPPAVRLPRADGHVAAVVELVAATFPEHPGSAANFWWPTTRKQAKKWLQQFLSERLEQFGPYEDAMSTRSDTVFHSLLSPFLNLGLLTPAEVIEAALKYHDSRPVALPSLEGFVRQVMGWREFIRGVYREFGDRQDETNFWSHHRNFAPSWYDGTTGLPPLDHAIRTARDLGWTHHIPRLMVLGNLMTLCEIEPAAAHRWFMEMYVDSSEWVMGPNVYGMGLFSDGGIFATKPYICGSNYLLKMSDYGRGDWCDTVDGLYWRFIDKHRNFFAKNPRLALMPRALDKIDATRREKIFAAAEDFLDKHTR